MRANPCRCPPPSPATGRSAAPPPAPPPGRSGGDRSDPGLGAEQARRHLCLGRRHRHEGHRGRRVATLQGQRRQRRPGHRRAAGRGMSRFGLRHSPGRWPTAREAVRGGAPASRRRRWCTNRRWPPPGGPRPPPPWWSGRRWPGPRAGRRRPPGTPGSGPRRARSRPVSSRRGGRFSCLPRRSRPTGTREPAGTHPPSWPYWPRWRRGEG